MISRSALKTVSIFLLLSSLIEVDAATASHKRRRGSSTRKLGIGYQGRVDTETTKGKGDGKSKGGKGGKGKGDSGTADDATVESPTPSPNVSGRNEPTTQRPTSFLFPTPSNANGDTVNPGLNPGLSQEDSLDGRLDDLTKGDTNGNENDTNLEIVVDVIGSSNGVNTDVDGTTPSDSSGTTPGDEDLFGNINGDGSTSIEVGTGNEGDDESDGNEGVEGSGNTEGNVNNGATEEGNDSNGTAGTVTGGGATGENGGSSSGVEGSNGSGTAGESGSSSSGVGGSNGSGTSGENETSGVGGSDGSGTAGESGSGSSGVGGSDGSGTSGESGNSSSGVEGSDESGTTGESGSGSSGVGGSDGSGTTGESGSGSSGVGGSNGSGTTSNTDGANESDGNGNGSDEENSNISNDVGDSGEVFDVENIWGVPNDDVFLDSDISTAVFCPEVSPDKEVLVNWIYAVEFLPELTTEEKSIAVTIMELKLVSELLECSSVALPGKLRNRHLLEVLEEGIAGLNYMPLDAKNDDIVCFFSNSTSDGVCETYFGRMEIYLQEDTIEQIAINKILYAIRDTMQRSDFPAVDGIKRVWYLDPNLNEISGIADGDGISDRQPPVDTSFSTGTMVAFAALGVFVFAALVLGAFRMRRNETDVITQFGDSTMSGWEQKSSFSAMLPNSYKLDDADGMIAIPEGSFDSDSRYNGSVILSEGGYTSDGDSHAGDPTFPTNFDNVLGANKSDEDDLQLDNELLFRNNSSDHRQTNLVSTSEVGLGVKHSAIDVHQCTSAQCSICTYKPKDVEFVHKSPNTPDISMTKFFPDDEGNNDVC